MLGLTKTKSASTSSTVLCRVVASADGQHTAGIARPRDEALRIFSAAVREAGDRRSLPGFRIQVLTDEEYQRRYGSES